MTDEDKERRALRRRANKEAATRSRKRRVLQLETLTEVSLKYKVSLALLRADDMSPGKWRRDKNR